MADMDFVNEKIQATYDTFREINRDYLNPSSREYANEVLLLSNLSRQLALTVTAVDDMILPEELRQWKSMFQEILVRTSKDLKGATKYGENRIRIDIVNQTILFFRSMGLEYSMPFFHYDLEMAKSLRYFNQNKEADVGMTAYQWGVIETWYEEICDGTERVIFHRTFNGISSELGCTKELHDLFERYMTTRVRWFELIAKHRHRKRVQARIKVYGGLIWFVKTFLRRSKKDSKT